ncbi:putative oxidoreductase bli-4, mitochondrial [Naviculisporaceae sp. PSN 640]
MAKSISISPRVSPIPASIARSAPRLSIGNIKVTSPPYLFTHSTADSSPFPTVLAPVHPGRAFSTAKLRKARIPDMETIKNTLAENLGGPVTQLGTTQFSLNDCPDLSSKVAVITGGTQGIGYAIAHTLLKNNISKVYLLSTTPEPAEKAKSAFQKEFGADAASRVTWLQCDLSDWPAVKKTADFIANDTDRLDILACNAGRGIMTPQLTDYGVDKHMAINHMGHVILTSQLLPLMKETAKRGNVVRISNQSSNLHNAAPGDTKFSTLDEINSDVGPNGQYGRSKLAAILWARYFDREVTKKGHPRVLMNATHPGFVSTKQSRKDIHEPYPISGYGVSTLVEPLKKNQFEGAVPSVYAVTMTDRSGQYICAPATVEKGSDMSQSDQLADDLMNLTRKVVSERAPGIEVTV